MIGLITGKRSEPKTSPLTELQERREWFEGALELGTILRLQFNGVNCWALLCKVGTLYKIEFFWEYQPLHDTAVTDETMEGLLAGVMETQEGEQLTFYNGSFAGCRDRLAYLEQLAVKNEPPAQLLLMSEYQRDLEVAGIAPGYEGRSYRKEVRYLVSKSFTIDPDTVEVEGKLASSLAKVGKLFQEYLSPQHEEQAEAVLHKVFKLAHDQWQDYTSSLEIAMGLAIVPLNGEQIWEQIWFKINGEQPCPPLPYYTAWDEDGIADVYTHANSAAKDTHLSTHLITEDGVPQAHREYVYLPNRKQFVAVLRCEELPDEWKSPEAKYKWLWDNLIGNDKFSDIEIYTQVSYADIDSSLKSVRDYNAEQARAASRAEDRGTPDKQAELTAEEAGEGQRMLLQGDWPVYVGCVVLAYAPTLEQLATKIRSIKKIFRHPAKFVQERNYAWKIWLQTLSLRTEPLLTSTDYNFLNDYRLKPNASASIGAIQAIGIRSRSIEGAEFISEKGGVSLLVGFEDPYGSPRHGAIFGRSGSGKSAMATARIYLAYARNFDGLILDLPDGNGNSTYSALVHHLGGIEFDTGKSSNNLLETSDIKADSSEDYAAQWTGFVKSINEMMLSLILDNVRSTDDISVSTIESVIPIATSNFYNDPTIQARNEAARRGGLESAAWKDWATLQDYYRRLTHENLHLEENDQNRNALAFIRLRLRRWLDGVYAQAIAAPSSFDISRSKLALFSLRNLNGDEEASLFGLSATQVALRKSLSSQRSYFFVDECSVLLKYTRLAGYLGQMLAVARKAGMSVEICMQDPNAIATCGASSQIRQNLSWHLTGRVNTGAIDSFIEIMKYPLEIIIKNTQEGFLPSKRGMFSRWLVDDDGLLTPARFYAAPIPLGLTLTNPPQVTARKQFLAAHQDDPLVGAALWGHEVQRRFSRGEDF